LDSLAASEIAFELCPGSNVSLGVFETTADVPLPHLLEAGVPIALGADDPLLFGTRLVDPYETARPVHGLDDAALASLAASSLRASPASAAPPSRLRSGVRQGREAQPGPAPAPAGN